MRESNFTNSILEILERHFGKHAETVFKRSELLQYIDKKTVSLNKGSKSRGSFANLYSIYILVEDYIKHGFFNEGTDYNKYEGASFSVLMKRQRELPFGAKLQNHALNSRTNAEFEKYFPASQQIPIVRDVKSQRYWINESLLNITVEDESYNIAPSVIEIIDKYVEEKRNAFKEFVSQCRKLQQISDQNSSDIREFLMSLMTPDMDARLFEIVSFAILKRVYADKTIFWGYERTKLKEEKLKLYKTGRTNANDGGIDFVIKPLGRFFQATETLDFKKYFLDIEKLEHYPVTFVVKSDEDINVIMSKIKANARKTYAIECVVNEYMSCIEEIINLNMLSHMLIGMDEKALRDILDEIILQSRVEFNQ